MKTTLLLLFLSLSFLSACTPGDPQVLSPSEMDARKNGGNRNDNKPGAANVRIPEKVEIPMGLLMEARHDQAQLVLKKSLELAKSGVETLLEDCVLTQLQEKSATSRKFKIQFQSCKTTSNGKEFEFSGAADLTLTLTESGDLVLVSYSTPKTGDTSAEAMVYILAGETPVMIADHTDLQLEQVRPGIFNLKKFSTETVVTSGPEGDVTAYSLPMETLSGQYTVTETGDLQSQYVSLIKAEASHTTGGKMQFSLEVEKKIDSPNYNFKKIFGNGRPNTGQLTLAEETVTLVPFRGKTTTVPRQKANAKMDAGLPWGFWL